MKKKLHRILGVLLTATLLTSLMVGLLAMPAAGARPPDIEDGPGPWARAIDGTFYAYAKMHGKDYLLKSTDDGHSWSRTKYAGDAVVDIAVSSLDAVVVYVLDTAGDIWKTTDAGHTWRMLRPLDGDITNTGAITSLAVGYIDDDPYLFAGTIGDGAVEIGGAFYFPEAIYGAIWGDLNLASEHLLAATDVDVWEIALSPNFGVDYMVMAIFVDKAANKTFATTKYDGAQWGADVSDAELRYNATGGPFSFGATSAVIWIPEDFDSHPGMWWMQYFVGVTAAANGGDVYHVITSCAFDRDIDGSNSDTNVAGFDGVGNVGGTSLLAGTDAGRIYRSTGYGITWSIDETPPAGSGNAYPILSDDFATSGEAWAAVDGDGLEGTISRTTDGGKNWEQIFPKHS